MTKAVRVIALKDHEWAAKPRKTGETYEADPQDVRFDALLKLGLAQLVPSDPDQPKPPESTKGRYQRRDMRPRE